MGAGHCSDQATNDFSKHIDGQLLRVNALLAASTVVTGVMVGIGAYGQRYRYHPLTGFLFLGASTLFLPILSYVVSSIGNQNPVTVPSHEYIIRGLCNTRGHIVCVFMWAILVQIAAVNTTAIVAGDDNKGRNIAPPATVLLVQAIWTSYLAVNFLVNDYYYSYGQWSLADVYSEVVLVLLPPFALIVAKLLVKYYAWYGARGSLAFGQNPRFIVGYMEQLKAELASEHSLPPLIVTGEDTTLVHKEPHGYSLKWLSNQADGTSIDNTGLVPIDKVWQLEDDIFLRYSTKQLKDVCFSFALFKLLRCRFSRHTIAKTSFMKAHNLLPHVLLQDGDDERAFGVIAHELSFLHDYYYSSLPTSYSRSWLPVFSISISLVSMGWSILYILEITRAIVGDASGGSIGQMHCEMECDPGSFKQYGKWYFDDVPVFLLAALVVLAELREIVSYICSNWTKVALICHYVRHASSWQQSPCKKKLLGLVLRCKCKLLKHWEDKMNQCSVLALHPSRTPMDLLRRLIPLLDSKKVPTAVKTAVLRPLRSPGWIPNNGVASLCARLHLQAGNNPLSACSGVKGVADTMLVAHIATSILEMRRPEPPRQPDSAEKIAATHMSRYCAYLVAYVPELLPDDDEWCKSLYKAVQKEAKRALAAAGSVGAAWDHEALYEALHAGPEAHDVLKNGAELGEKLVDLADGEGEEAAWEVLADFWSEMILYAAPSDNVDGHAEAIARGGELITLLWALLTHVGAVSRPEATTNASGDV